MPVGWAYVSFTDALDIVSDRGLRLKQKAYQAEGALPVVDQGDGLVGGYTDDLQFRVDSTSPVFVFGDHTRRFKYVDFPFAVGADGVKLLSPTQLWNPRFLFLQLGTVNLEDRGYGRHFQQLRAQSFVLPPLSEQTRIVEKLEELLSDLDAGVAELKAAQAKLQHYRQSLLKAAVAGSLTQAWREANPAPEETSAELLARILVERRARWEAQQLAKFEAQGKTPPNGWQGKYSEPIGPDRNDLPQLPADWVWASVDQLSQSVRNGVSSTPNKDGVGLPILRINAVRPMQVRLDEIRHLDVPPGEVSDYFVEAGDLLATRYNGSVDLLGVFGLVKGVTVPVLHPDKLIRMRPVLEQVLGPWLEIAANAGASRRYIVGRVKTTAGQTGISGEDLKKMPVPLPPLAEQSAAAEQITSMLAAVEQQVSLIEHGLAQSTAQRQNLLRAAFTGQLVPQDPADEPAAELLARLRAECDAGQPAAKRSRSKKVTA